MSHPRFAVSLLFCSALASSSATAQTIPSPYTFVENGQEWGVFVGKADMNPGQVGLGPRDGNVFGARYGVAFGAMAALDVYGVWFDSSRDVLDASRPAEENNVLGRTDFSIILGHVRLRINVTGQRAWHGIQPFLAFGGGVAGTGSIDRVIETTVGVPASEWFEFGPVFTGVFGAGMNYHVSNGISLRLEGEADLWKVGTPLGWRTLVNDPLGRYPEDEWVPAYVLTLGAAWRR